MIQRKRVFFSGRVQGVGFRYTTKQLSRQFSVAGWVRNRTDGRVEMLVEGPATEVNAFVDQILTRTHGQIVSFDKTSEDPQGDLQGFEIVETV